MTQQLLNAQNSLLTAQNDLYNTWVGYLTLRMSLYRDLGLMPLDPRGVWIDAVTTCSCDPSTFEARGQVGHLDADLVRLPLTVATRKPGDRMRPLGLSQPKRLQDILVDAHIPRHVRDNLPVVSDSEEIVWIPGVTVAESKRVTAATHRQLHLEIERR